jgi:hypothetical protein
LAALRISLLKFSNLLARISSFSSRSYRALGIESPGGILWFWIGLHAEYKQLIRG